MMGNTLHHCRKSAALFLIALALSVNVRARADTLPLSLTREQAAATGGTLTNIDRPASGFLLVPPGERRAVEERSGNVYRGVVYVYTQDKPGEGRAAINRFILHAPTTAELPLLRRAGNLLLQLHWLIQTHFGIEHPADMPALDVWITGKRADRLSADVGGEQRRNQIYIYNLEAERSAVEWVRELAHEYGHFIVPGITGYTSPEEWANGVLGERLFLKWLTELKVTPNEDPELSFVRNEELNAYYQQQIEPIWQRSLIRGWEKTLLARTDEPGMDGLTGMALAVDSLYGSRLLLGAFSSMAPPPERFALASDFLHGLYVCLNEQNLLEIYLPSTDSIHSGRVRICLPKGRYSQKIMAGAPGLKFAADPALKQAASNIITVTRNGWYTLILPANSSKASLSLRRLGNGGG